MLMARKLFVFGTLLILTACSQVAQMSWDQKQIEALHYSERIEPMDVATQIKNQEACEKYATGYMGEAISEQGDWNIFQEYRYSPLYDKCFAKRTANNLKKDETQIFIFDVLSGKQGGILSYRSWCRDAYIKNGYPLTNIEYECPREEEINRAWLSLIGDQ